MATGIHEITGEIIDGVIELKQRIQRCMKTRRRTLPLARGYGSNLPNSIDRNITPELDMDIYAGVADMLAYPPNEFINELKLNTVWIERGQNSVTITIDITLLFDGSVEQITGFTV